MGVWRANFQTGSRNLLANVGNSSRAFVFREKYCERCKSDARVVDNYVSFPKKEILCLPATSPGLKYNQMALYGVLESWALKKRDVANFCGHVSRK